MAHTSDKDELISAANLAFPDSYVAESAASREDSHVPKELLAGFIVATIDDLCGESSSRDANLERVALALEVGSANLQAVVRSIRLRATS